MAPERAERPGHGRRHRRRKTKSSPPSGHRFPAACHHRRGKRPAGRRLR
ncbi:MAG: hypothetical protein MZV70_07550 [Desulfobacterales bacterium]|nr:hypothetical protein [Desulfobacterales bacterium]